MKRGPLAPIGDALGFVGLALAGIAAIAIVVGVPFALLWAIVRVIRLAWSGE